MIRIGSSDTKRLRSFRTMLLRWFADHQRPLPWRSVRDPYHVLVSEVMLQQTQAFRVEQYFKRFIERYPTISSLAKAMQQDVIRSWQGLGYNRRAINLHKTAKVLNGNPFPNDIESLKALPGIGDYTSRAIITFAYGADISVVDVNIARVLSRITRRMRTHSDQLPLNDIHRINESLIPRGNNAVWTEALMDIGASICKKKPKCSECPVKSVCRSAHLELIPRSSLVSAEPPYFGHPRRIWRGKVLNVIANTNALSAVSISNTLRSSSFDKYEFDTFIRSVLNSLETEGFILRVNGKYQLR